MLTICEVGFQLGGSTTLKRLQVETADICP